MPKDSLADGTEGCGCLMKGFSGSPTFSPLCGAGLLSEWGASFLSPRVTCGWHGRAVVWLQQEWAQPTLPCSPGHCASAPGIHFVHMLIFFILFLFSFPPPHLLPAPVFLSLIPLVFLRENTWKARKRKRTVPPGMKCMWLWNCVSCHSLFFIWDCNLQSLQLQKQKKKIVNPENQFFQRNEWKPKPGSPSCCLQTNSVHLHVHFSYWYTQMLGNYLPKCWFLRKENGRVLD